MRTGIEQARIDLLKWESCVREDEAALAEAQSHLDVIRERLEHSKRAANGLRHAVQQWDAMQARLKTPNSNSQTPPVR